MVGTRAAVIVRLFVIIRPIVIGVIIIVAVAATTFDLAGWAAFDVRVAITEASLDLCAVAFLGVDIDAEPSLSFQTRSMIVT